MEASYTASARMYAVAPGAAAAWRHLFALVARRSGLTLDYIEHAHPAPLDALWSRPDLGCAFMCGWPYAREAESALAQRPVLAAPVPDATWAGAQAIYHSAFLVPAGSPALALDDTFGGRFAFNATSSHSGYNLPRATLAAHGRTPLFATVVGPLTTPRRCIEAVADGRADVTAVDSYALLLLERHDPALAHTVRVIARSASSPIPPLVGAPGMDQEAFRLLRATLTRLHYDADGREALASLCLSSFLAVEPAVYTATLTFEPAAMRTGYRVLC